MRKKQTIFARNAKNIGVVITSIKTAILILNQNATNVCRDYAKGESDPQFMTDAEARVYFRDLVNRIWSPFLTRSYHEIEKAVEL